MEPSEILDGHKWAKRFHGLEENLERSDNSVRYTMHVIPT